MGWFSFLLKRRASGKSLSSRMEDRHICSHSEERVRKGAEKLTKFLNAKQQGRLDGFFSVKGKEAVKGGGKGHEAKKAGASSKRKVRMFTIKGTE
jgi:hypothetical protein